MGGRPSRTRIVFPTRAKAKLGIQAANRVGRQVVVVVNQSIQAWRDRWIA